MIRYLPEREFRQERKLETVVVRYCIIRIQAMGTTLQNSHVTVDEALSGSLKSTVQ